MHSHTCTSRISTPSDGLRRLTLEVVNSLVHLDGLPDRRPLLPTKEVAQFFEVILILVERSRHLAMPIDWGMERSVR